MIIMFKFSVSLLKTKGNKKISHMWQILCLGSDNFLE